MTHAVVARAYGSPEVLAVVEVDLPEPSPGEVLVSVRAAGVNPADWKSYSGLWGTDAGRLPLRLGFEAAGVVEAVGPGVTSVVPGDEVIAYRTSGAYAEHLVVPVAALTPKPAGLGWAEAGGLMLAGATAWHALDATGVGDGDTVLVHGGAGGVGSMTVQLAVARGARVVATASEANHDYLRELGAVPVEYGAGLAERVHAATGEVGASGGCGAGPGAPVTAAVDTVGTDEALDVSVELVGRRERIATVANFTRGPELGIRVLGGGPGADPGDAVRAAARSPLARLAGSGELVVSVAATYPLAEAAAAHQDGMPGRTRGKRVLVVPTTTT